MKILIVRIGRLGDIVMVLPALAEIKKKYPHATIYALTSTDGHRLLKSQGFDTHQIHCYSNHLYKRRQEIHKVRAFLSQHQFDHIFCFENKARTTSWLPKSAIVMDERHRDEHYAKRCIRLVSHVPEDVKAVPYLNTIDVDISESLKQHGITPNTLLIGLHPTYSGFNKWGRAVEKSHRIWPESSFAQLVLTMSDMARENKRDIRFIMDLLPEERPVGQRIQALTNNQLIIQCQPPHFQRYLNYIKRLNVLVAPNTGVMHLAAALNTPTVALFSNANPGDCGPYMHPERYRVIQAEDYANGQATMASIPVQSVVDAVLSLLPG